MACGTVKNELTPTARKVLKAIKNTPLTIDDIAIKAKLPLFKVRSNLRYLAKLNFVILKNNAYVIDSEAKRLI